MTKERGKDSDRPIPLIYKTNTDPSRRTIAIALEHGLRLNMSTLSRSGIQYDKVTSEILAEEDDESKPPRYIKVDLSQPDRTRSYQGTREETSNEQVKFLMRERTLINESTGTSVKVYELTRLDDYYRLTPLNSFSNISFEEMMDHYNNRSKRLNKFYLRDKIGRDAAAKDKEKADSLKKPEAKSSSDAEEGEAKPDDADIKKPKIGRKSRKRDFNEDNDDEDFDARELDYGVDSSESDDEKESSEGTEFEDDDVTEDEIEDVDLPNDDDQYGQSESDNDISINGKATEHDDVGDDTNFTTDSTSQARMEDTDDAVDKLESDNKAELDTILQMMVTDTYFSDDDESEPEVKKKRNVDTDEFLIRNEESSTEGSDSDSSLIELIGP